MCTNVPLKYLSSTNLQDGSESLPRFIGEFNFEELLDINPKKAKGKTPDHLNDM